VITCQYFKRYHLPVMHTETNIHDIDGAPHYLEKQWANIVRLRQDAHDSRQPRRLLGYS
jgi:hypothetical protein